MPTGAVTPALPTPFSAPAQTAPASPDDTCAEPLQRADSVERACYHALKSGLYELKGASKCKLPIKAGWAATSAVKGFRKGLAEPAPNASAPPALQHLSLGESPQRSSSGLLPSLLRTHSGASQEMRHASSSASVNTLLRTSSRGEPHHSASSGSLTGLSRSGSSGTLSALHHSGSSGSLSALSGSASHGSLSNLGRSSSQASMSPHAAAPSSRPIARAPMLRAVREAEDAEGHYGKVPRKSLERHERRHPYAAPSRAQVCIAPYQSVVLRAPEQPATYRLQVSLGCLDLSETAFATRLMVATEAPLWVSADVCRLPLTLQAAPLAEIALQNATSAHVVARVGEPLLHTQR